MGRMIIRPYGAARCGFHPVRAAFLEGKAGNGALGARLLMFIQKIFDNAILRLYNNSYELRIRPCQR
jgi:hypothetical protein